jgi:VWFA-related protein
MSSKVLGVLALFTTFAQESIRVDVELVRVPCTVTNGKGETVKHLEAKDFSIADNGRKRPVQYLGRETDLPLTVGLLVDVSGSQRKYVRQHREALRQFFEQVLRKGDRAFIAAVAGNVRLIQDFSDSAEALTAAVDRVDAVRGQRMGKPCPAREMILPNRVIYVPICGGSVIWDGVYYAAEKLRAADGRKALILMTDAEDSGSPHTLEEAIGMAQSAETIVYTIKAVERRKLRDAWKKPLENLAEQTGGLPFNVRYDKPSEIFAKIQDELRTQYVLGFNAEGPRDGKFHTLKVTVAGRGNKVRTRSGYWARKEEQ